MSHTDKYLRVHDKYKLMGETSMRMLVTHLVEKLKDDENLWVDLGEISKHRNENRLCSFLDTYTRYLFAVLPIATVAEEEANSPNAVR